MQKIELAVFRARGQLLKILKTSKQKYLTLTV